MAGSVIGNKFELLGMP